MLVPIGEHCFVIFRGILPEEPEPQGLGSGGIHEIATSFQAEPVHEAKWGCGAIAVLSGGDILQSVTSTNEATCVTHTV